MKLCICSVPVLAEIQRKLVTLKRWQIFLELLNTFQNAVRAAKIILHIVRIYDIVREWFDLIEHRVIDIVRIPFDFRAATALCKDRITVHILLNRLTYIIEMVKQLHTSAFTYFKKRSVDGGDPRSMIECLVSIIKAWQQSFNIEIW